MCARTSCVRLCDGGARLCRPCPRVITTKSISSVQRELSMEQLFGAMTQALPGTLTILNVAILLFAIFFFTRTLASHVLEAVVGFWNSRGKELRDGLATALGTNTAAAIYDTPLIRSLKNGKHPPSYIEPEFFA